MKNRAKVVVHGVVVKSGLTRRLVSSLRFPSPIMTQKYPSSCSILKCIYSTMTDYSLFVTAPSNQALQIVSIVARNPNSCRASLYLSRDQSPFNPMKKALNMRNKVEEMLQGGRGLFTAWEITCRSCGSELAISWLTIRDKRDFSSSLEHKRQF